MPETKEQRTSGLLMALDPRLVNAFQAQNGFALEPHLLAFELMGSHGHGAYLPPAEPNAVDDIDLMGFVVPAVEYHLGLPRWEHTKIPRSGDR